MHAGALSMLSSRFFFMHKWLQRLGCLLVLFLPEAASADGRDERAPEIYVGGGGGVGLVTTANTSGVVLYENRLGVTAGLFAGWRLTNFLSVQLDATFSTKGAEATRDGLPFGVFYRSYAEFPILLKLVASSSSRITPHAVLGPALSILLQADSNLADGRHLDLVDRTERIDLGLMVGAGASIDVGASKAVYVDVRYNHGLLNYNKIALGEDDEARNRAFYVTVGYQTDLSVFSGGQ
jgi:hypothetical protein